MDCLLFSYRGGWIIPFQGNKSRLLRKYQASSLTYSLVVLRQSTSEQSTQSYLEENVQGLIAPGRSGSFMLLLPS